MIIMHMSHTIAAITKFYSAITVTPLDKIAVTTSAFLIALFVPIQGLLLTCFIFSIVDLIYGIQVARKFKSKITSKKTWQGTIRKIIDEFTIILLSRMLEFTVLGNDGVFILTGGVTVIIALTELWSILESLNTLNPNGPWRHIGMFLKKKGSDYVGVGLYDHKHDEHTSDNNVATKP